MTPFQSTFKEVRPLFTSQLVAGKFAKALLSERNGDDKAAEAYLNEAIAQEQKELAS